VPKAGWTYLVTGVAGFMVAMDNLVVTNALPVIRVELGTGLEGLERTVNTYTLTFAVFLPTGAGRPVRPPSPARRRPTRARVRRGRGTRDPPSPAGGIRAGHSARAD
jgi:hypothetical protein